MALNFPACCQKSGMVAETRKFMHTVFEVPCLDLLRIAFISRKHAVHYVADRILPLV